MCGRYAMNKETDDLIVAFVASGGRAQDWRPSFSVAPSTEAPIVRERSKDGILEREIDLATWGLRPAWAKDSGPKPINARLESVATGGMFRTAFASHRCIVPMLGYYEWETLEADGKKVKQPHFIHGDIPILAAAGLYALRKVGDEWALSYTIVTREARDASGDVHDRMPVFLSADHWDEWLSPVAITEPESTLDMLDHSSTLVAGSMTAYAVDRKVNNSATLDPADSTLIEAITPA